MKKLMFAAAAIAAGVAMADIKSNVVGYNSTEAVMNENMTFIGASFEKVGEGEIITLNSLTSPQEIVDGDQIQMANTDEDGLVYMTDYEYWDGDGWVDLASSEPVGDTIGFKIGQAAWFLSSEPKSITVSGQVKKENHIHTFTDSMTIITSAFPVNFCPNGENVSWGCLDSDQIQVPWTDNDGLVHMTDYEYWDGDGWVDLSTSEALDPEFPIVKAGKGFWFITSDPTSSSFAEVSPLVE